MQGNDNADAMSFESNDAVRGCGSPPPPTTPGRDPVLQVVQWPCRTPAARISERTQSLVS